MWPASVMATNEPWVDLTGQLSNPSPALRRMLEGKNSRVSVGAATRLAERPRRQPVHLSDTQQAELVQ